MVTIEAMGNRSKKTGRPSLYSPELAEIILDRLIEGESLRSICRDSNMPSRGTVLKWVAGYVADVPDEFRDNYTRARKAQAYGFLDELPDIADNNAMDLIEVQSEKGFTYEKWNHDWVNRNKLMIEVRKYLAERFLGEADTEQIDEAVKRYVNAPPEAHSYNEWIKTVQQEQ